MAARGPLRAYSSVSPVLRQPANARLTEDARGLVVSDRGDRQVAASVAAADVPPRVAEAIGDRLTVLFDSGVRTGDDVLKVLALGARAVLPGRPYVYGLGLDGQAGVEQSSTVCRRSWTCPWHCPGTPDSVRSQRPTAWRTPLAPHPRTVVGRSLGGVSTVLCGARDVGCVLSACRTKAPVLDALGVSAGAASVRAGRRGRGAGCSNHPLTTGD
ncbi:hypothetical protein LK08_06210 [Streptomyces sp. MUSC 125]|nr:hypothetical protein LK08_06210 [Streptomyces sp. MUSC 125]